MNREELARVMADAATDHYGIRRRWPIDPVYQSLADAVLQHLASQRQEQYRKPEGLAAGDLNRQPCGCWLRPCSEAHELEIAQAAAQGEYREALIAIAASPCVGDCEGYCVTCIARTALAPPSRTP